MGVLPRPLEYCAEFPLRLVGEQLETRPRNWFGSSQIRSGDTRIGLGTGDSYLATPVLGAAGNPTRISPQLVWEQQNRGAFLVWVCEQPNLARG